MSAGGGLEEAWHLFEGGRFNIFTTPMTLWYLMVKIVKIILCNGYILQTIKCWQWKYEKHVVHVTADGDRMEKDPWPCILDY